MKMFEPKYSKASGSTATCCGMNELLLLTLNLPCTRFSGRPVVPPYLSPLYCSWFYIHLCTALLCNGTSPHLLVAHTEVVHHFCAPCWTFCSAACLFTWGRDDCMQYSGCRCSTDRNSSRTICCFLLHPFSNNASTILGFFCFLML